VAQSRCTRLVSIVRILHLRIVHARFAAGRLIRTSAGSARGGHVVDGVHVLETEEERPARHRAGCAFARRHGASTFLLSARSSSLRGRLAEHASGRASRSACTASNILCRLASHGSDTPAARPTSTEPDLPLSALPSLDHIACFFQSLPLSPHRRRKPNPVALDASSASLACSIP
jgi:hypothetical protein